MDSAARPFGDEAAGFEQEAQSARTGTVPSHLDLLPNSLLARVLFRVSVRTGGYSHALVCRRWAALAPSTQARVRLCPPWNPGRDFKWRDKGKGLLDPDRGTVAWRDFELHVSMGELTQALQSLPHVTALDLPGYAMYGVTQEQFLRLLGACPRLRALRAPGLSLRTSPADPRDEGPFWKLRRTNTATLSPAVLLECTPGLRILNVRRSRLYPLSDEEATPAVAVEEALVPAAVEVEGVLVPATGDHGAGNAFALQQLQVLNATVEVPYPAELVQLRSMPNLKALSLKLLRDDDEQPASTVVICSPSLKDLSLEVPETLRLELGPLPALRALSLTLYQHPLDIAGFSCLSSLTSLALSTWGVSLLEPLHQTHAPLERGDASGGGSSGGDASGGDPERTWLLALTALKSLTWHSSTAQLPVSALSLTRLTSLDVYAGALERARSLAGWQQLRILHSLSVAVDAWCANPEQLIESLAELRSLKELTVFNNTHECINLKILSSLHMLTSVVASGPGITGLALQNLTGLKQLVINQKPFTSDKGILELQSGPCVQRLERLVLSPYGRHELSLQPLSILQALKELSVFDCWALREVHPSLGALSRLHRLQLDGLDRVCSLPPSFFSPPNFLSLTHLRLRLPLKEWPSSLEDLPHLKLLAVNQVSFRERAQLMLKDLLMPSSLEALELKFCNLIMGAKIAGVDLPSPMPMLRRLALSDIKSITSLPRNLGSLRSLRHLQLLNLPRVESLPRSFSELSQLHGLVVQGCSKVKKIPQGSGSLPCFVNDPELLAWFELCDPSTC